MPTLWSAVVKAYVVSTSAELACSVAVYAIASVTGTVAGQKYYAVADGSGISTTVVLNAFVGFTVEADRLVVRASVGTGAVS